MRSDSFGGVYFKSNIKVTFILIRKSVHVLTFHTSFSPPHIPATFSRPPLQGIGLRPPSNLLLQDNAGQDGLYEGDDELMATLIKCQSDSTAAADKTL